MDEHRLGELERKVGKHHRDLYEGNGKPSITTRIALMEDAVSKISRNLSKITWLLVAALLAALGDLVARAVH